jgi:hypothetical protein
VPALDRVFILEAGVAAEPGPLGDLVHQERRGIGSPSASPS